MGTFDELLFCGEGATSSPMSPFRLYNPAELHERSRNSLSESCFMATIVLRKPQPNNLSASHGPGNRHLQ